MLQNTSILSYHNLKLYYSSHEGELYVTSDPFIIIKVYYFTNDNYDNEISAAVSQLIPQYVPKIHLKHETEDYVALIMERIQGITLFEYIEKRSCNIKIIFKVVISLTNAIIGIHKSGFVHCDLHARNIIITDNNEVKVIDFGCADNVDALDESDMVTPKIFEDYLQLKSAIALIIFPLSNDISIVTIIKTIRNYTVNHVIGYNTNPMLANKLYTLLISFPSIIEDDIH